MFQSKKWITLSFFRINIPLLQILVIMSKFIPQTLNMHPEFRIAACKKLKELRKKHGYSQSAVAYKLNMEQNSYSRLEAGMTKIDIERLQQITSLYKICLMDFLQDITPPLQ
jgi:DNA-binding XRE family transcriptional regulator